MAEKVKIFFLTEPQTSGPEDDRRTFTVSQFMMAGVMLVALEEGDQGGEDQGPPGKTSDEKADIELIPGYGVKLSADKKALLATTPGYPKFTRKKESSGEKVTIDIEPIFCIIKDKWTVTMTLYPPVTGTVLPSVAEILGLLEEAGVRSGILEKDIAACVAEVKVEMRPLIDQVVARGRLPVNVENARLRIEVAVGVQPGQELENGHFDFRERHFFTPVEKGQLLATKISATAGMPGVNVLGSEVPQIPGKDLVIKTTEDILFDEETGKIHAAVSGVVSTVTDTSVRVTSKLVLSSDIDFHIGNVESRNAVGISGSIKPGFKVTNGADLVIGGSVESAHIVCHGNVVIRGGIMGEVATIEADGDVDTPVIGNGSISCKGSVRISREAYFASIKAQKDIFLTGQAIVISCDLFAGGSITVVDVDTDSSSNSMLAAATMPDRYARYEDLLKAYYLAEAAVEAWIRRFGIAATNDKLKALNGDLVDAKAALTSYNLVPGVGEYDRSGGLHYACQQIITVKGLIRSGAVIRIGNSETTLKKTYGEGHFALNSDTSKIEFHSAGKSLKKVPVE